MNRRREFSASAHRQCWAFSLRRGTIGRMRHFSTKDLFLATTFTAAGMFPIYLALLHGVWHEWSPVVPYLLWFGGGAIIGAGILAPFRKPWIGALAGV